MPVPPPVTRQTQSLTENSRSAVRSEVEHGWVIVEMKMNKDGGESIVSGHFGGDKENKTSSCRRHRASSLTRVRVRDVTPEFDGVEMYYGGCAGAQNATTES